MTSPVGVDGVDGSNKEEIEVPINFLFLFLTMCLEQRTFLECHGFALFSKNTNRKLKKNMMPCEAIIRINISGQEKT
jgi:hypothetical protein